MIDRFILKIRELVHFFLHLNLYFGKKVILRGVPKILYGNRIEFGENVIINDKVFLHAANRIKIGNNTTLSYGACIISESYDVTDKIKYLKKYHSGAPITIGKNVWIAANVVILPGVSIEDNIIVGAGSVVTKSLTSSNSLYAGNPAKFIKKMEI